MPTSTAIDRLLIAVSTVLLLAVAPAKADFEISIGSGTVDPGGNLLLDIGLASDAPPQNLAEFELILEITPMSAAAGSSLVFVDPQSETFLQSADYIFVGNSDSLINGFDATIVSSPVEIIVSDGTADFSNTSVTGGHLLASVDLAHFLGGASAAATAGDQYGVSVRPESFFAQASGDEIDFSFTPGVVTVGAVAIPEPAAATILMLATCGVALQRRRRSCLLR
ncbi:hypothetical protein NZK35_22890 [Stieleria sp. ICT_E10.1]|uniref:hypothetical protein n=1 Tax=Stieleria sedimenti TaxID=2976331 RepID=UPI00217F79FC|nr:hypothetical protein [Stieleria sedimenti]MCS7469509.1 hypothetical protein [Stieleria sedimenti]